MRKLVRTVLAGEGRAGAEVGLLLTDNADLREMNRVYRGIDRVTDVLAFPDGDGDENTRGSRDSAGGGPAPHLPVDSAFAESTAGDIAISLERAVEQAPRFSATFEQEVARLVIHGLLHLLGYDHHMPADGRRMKARERFYLAGVARGSIVPPPRRKTGSARTTGGAC